MGSYVLVTGGCGYIGTHTVVELLNEGYHVVVVDNLLNSSEESLLRVKKITGKEVVFHKTDIQNQVELDALFSAYPFSSVIHFAGLKAVGESVSLPLDYYSNNISGTLVLLKVMKKHNVKNIVFSSSATVYGNPKTVPITEQADLEATNPYGRTKLYIEEILRDLSVSDPEWNAILLRYFNPVGAHSSGLLGEDPKGVPNNLMPYISQTAIGKREFLSVFGRDWATPDGTGVRDYIHVVDLAKGHIAAVRHLDKKPRCAAFNLGTGRGYSVLEMVEAMKQASGKEIPYKFAPRRPGDIAACYADPSKAATELNWKAELSLDDMVRDTWNWQSRNPNGYS